MNFEFQILCSDGIYKRGEKSLMNQIQKLINKFEKNSNYLENCRLNHEQPEQLNQDAAKLQLRKLLLTLLA